MWEQQCRKDASRVYRCRSDERGRAKHQLCFASPSAFLSCARSSFAIMKLDQPMDSQSCFDTLNSRRTGAWHELLLGSITVLWDWQRVMFFPTHSSHPAFTVWPKLQTKYIHFTRTFDRRSTQNRKRVKRAPDSRKHHAWLIQYVYMRRP
jgi:hypothetical protein